MCDNMLFSHVKISCFRWKDHLVFHWRLIKVVLTFSHVTYVLRYFRASYPDMGGSWVKQVELDEAMQVSRIGLKGCFSARSSVTTFGSSEMCTFVLKVQFCNRWGLLF